MGNDVKERTETVRDLPFGSWRGHLLIECSCDLPINSLVRQIQLRQRWPTRNGCFLKWWNPTTMGFPTKKDNFGVFWGYHHLRKHPNGAKTERLACPNYRTDDLAIDRGDQADAFGRGGTLHQGPRYFQHSTLLVYFHVTSYAFQCSKNLHHADIIHNSHIAVASCGKGDTNEDTPLALGLQSNRKDLKWCKTQAVSKRKPFFFNRFSQRKSEKKGANKQRGKI